MAQQMEEHHDAEMLIGGSWTGKNSNSRLDVSNPYTGETIGTITRATESEVEEAVEAANKAYESSVLSAYERYELLENTAGRLETEAEEMAQIITAEQGKPLNESRTEVDRAIQALRLSGEEAKRQFGEYVPMDAQKGFDRTHAFTQREPLGVVAAITPFNFPLNLMVHKIGPALAAGNSVVGKPASNTPLCAIRLFEHLEESRKEVGAPEGLVNIVTGSGSTAGETFVSHEAVEAISFTGSTSVGKQFAENAGMRELTLELGGNDPTVIWDDTDIQKAADRVVGGACSNAGQVCNSVERVIVPESIEKEVVDALVNAAEELTIGDPLESGTDISSLVDDDQFESVVDLYEQSVAAGASVECGGNYGGDLGERVFEPTVLSDVSPEMPAAKEETFGPLVPVISVPDFEAAIEEANNTNYGLEAGLFTQDIDRAKRYANEVEAGGVNINTISGFRTDHMPYGGFKDSGVGKEGIKYACEHFSKAKLVGFHSGFGSAN